MICALDDIKINSSIWNKGMGRGGFCQKCIAVPLGPKYFFFINKVSGQWKKTLVHAALISDQLSLTWLLFSMIVFIEIITCCFAISKNYRRIEPLSISNLFTLLIGLLLSFNCIYERETRRSFKSHGWKWSVGYTMVAAGIREHVGYNHLFSTFRPPPSLFRLYRRWVHARTTRGIKSVIRLWL